MNNIETKLPLNFSELNGFYESINNLADSIKQSLKCLFLTSKGERVRDTDFGIGVSGFLFEIVNNNITREQMIGEIRRQIEKYIPFLNIDTINVNFSENLDKMYIKLEYFVPRVRLRDSISLEV